MGPDSVKDKRQTPWGWEESRTGSKGLTAGTVPQYFTRYQKGNLTLVS